MTPEAQRIAIAEACGYRCEKFTGSSFPFTIVNPHNIRSMGYATEASAWHHNSPGYLNDLNACHEFEKGLVGPRCEIYANWLSTLVVISSPGISLEKITTTPKKWVWHATAAQRAEAFLKTIGKWVEPAALNAKEDGHE